MKLAAGELVLVLDVLLAREGTGTELLTLKRMEQTVNINKSARTTRLPAP